MEKTKTTYKIMFCILMVFAIMLGIYCGYRQYSTMFNSDIETNSSVLEDSLILETDANKLNDHFLNFKPSEGAKIYDSNFRLIKKMTDLGNFVMIRINVDESPRLIFFNDNKHQEDRGEPCPNILVDLQNLGDIYTLECNLVDRIRLKNIFYKTDYESFFSEHFDLETPKHILNPYKLNMFLNIDFCYKPKILKNNVLQFFFLHEDYILVRNFYKSTQHDEWEFVCDTMFCFLDGLDVKNLLTYLICTGLHSIQLEENFPDD